jgi:hypothetical protein
MGNLILRNRYGLYLNPLNLIGPLTIVVVIKVYGKIF